MTHVVAAARAELTRMPTRVVVLVLDSVSVNEILEHIDLNAIVSRVDLNAIVGKVDMNAILNQVDLEALLDQIDLNAMIEKVDLDALVKSTDVGAIIAHSTGGVASDAVDLVRRQAVGVDEFVAALAGRLRLKRAQAPAGPPLLLGEGA
jgi:hypothetical protein